MRVTVNGTPREVQDGLTVEALILALAGGLRGSAVVLDGEVVPRSQWAARLLAEGTDVELITAVQGG